MPKGIVNRFLWNLDSFVGKYENEQAEPQSETDTSMALTTTSPKKGRSILQGLVYIPGLIFGTITRPVVGLVSGYPSQRRTVVKESVSPQKSQPPTTSHEMFARRTQNQHAFSAATRAPPPPPPEATVTSINDKDDSYWEQLYGDTTAERILYGGGSDCGDISGPDSLSGGESPYTSSLADTDPSVKTASQLLVPATPPHPNPQTLVDQFQQAATAIESNLADAGMTLQKESKAVQEWFNQPFGAFQPRSPTDKKDGRSSECVEVVEEGVE
eukprot:CAMPEP_0181306510 /NCGR_PEP_ID=MMETSP1101-20121128/10344_1 /TAXON_ID=46948 /ORGANISM="Rhodomonas abbreviata, Strain Caron Lab Isolate" /LENGTH=270 /DNA_ID=CAMNT_0023412583 /DNA_START=46 /DNA_END=859 /DNA_ORIENTATION=-